MKWCHLWILFPVLFPQSQMWCSCFLAALKFSFLQKVQNVHGCVCAHTHTREWLQAFKPRSLLTKGTVSLRKLRLAFTTTISDYDLPQSFKCYFPFTISLSFILYTWFNLHFLIEWITFNNLKSHSQQHQLRKGHVFLTSCMHLSCRGDLFSQTLSTQFKLQY